jgi:nitroreductase
VGLRAVRDFAADPLDPTHLEMILEAARWTGSAKNRQDWSFVVLDDAEAKRGVAAAGDFTGPMLAAPVAIAIVQEPGGYEFDSGRVAQNIMLAADTLGVASCPVTLHRDDEAAAALGLPSGRRCRYAIALGYPGDRARGSLGGGRKPLSDLVRRNRYR